MANAAVFTACLASIILNAKRVDLDPRTLSFHRSRVEPTDPDELQARNQRRKDLASSWLECPVNEVYARDGDLALADGNERISGCLLLGVDKVRVCLLPADTPDSVLDSFSVLTDVHKTKLKPFELAGVIKRYIDTARVKKGEAAAAFHIDAGYLTRLLSVFDCPSEVQAAAEAGRIGPDDWYSCSKSPDPLATLGIRLGGGGRDAVRRSAKPKAPAVRLAKIKVPLTSGVTIQVAGEEISLEEAAEALKDALKAVNQAIGKSLDAKTAQLYWKDIAAAG